MLKSRYSRENKYAQDCFRRAGPESRKVQELALLLQVVRHKTPRDQRYAVKQNNASVTSGRQSEP